MGARYVFISYARPDRDFVKELTARLRHNGVETWTDLENIAPGQNWQETIEHGLLDASALVYVASQSSTSSRWMEFELKAFIEKGATVVPVVIDDAGAESLPAFLRQIQWADFRQSFEDGFASLIQGLRTLQSEAPIETVKAQSKGYVFLSYAAEDNAFVDELKAFMQQKGYAYWDFRESRRSYQKDYSIELETVIQESEGVLSVISPSWKSSPNTLQELHFSREINKPVFLLKIKDPGPTLAISGMTYINFMENRDRGFFALDQEMHQVGM